MKCVKNKNHTGFTTICPTCVNEINKPTSEPCLADMEPELRALFMSMKSSKRVIGNCWYVDRHKIKVKNRTFKVENLFYAFYKGDIANAVLKPICADKNCVNPAHRRSRFEKTTINKVVTSGFNRRKVDFTKIPDAQWLREA